MLDDYHREVCSTERLLGLSAWNPTSLEHLEEDDDDDG